LIYELKGHSGGVNAVAFGPYGKTLASGGADGRIVLWNTSNGSKILSQKGHKGWIRDIVFNPDGTLLASCGDDKLIHTWQAQSLKESGTFKGHKDWVQTIDFSPDGKTLISGGRDRLIILWDVITQQVLLQSEKQDQVILSVDISPVKSDFISSCYGSEELETWVLSGLDETQWTNAEVSSLGQDQAVKTEEQSVSRIAPNEEAVPDNSMIELFAPVPVQGRIVHDSKSINLIGRANDPDGISIFLINKTPVTLSETGIFQYTLALNEGENSLDLVAVNNKGKMNELKLYIDCTAEGALVTAEEPLEISKEKYYALLIGINEYQDPEIVDLDNPIHDAESLRSVLRSEYTFEEDNIKFLKNPTQD